MVKERWFRGSDPEVLTKLRADFRTMHWEQRRTLDYDPVYPLLRRMSELLGRGREGAAEASLMHGCWYHLGSTLAVWSDLGTVSEFSTQMPRLLKMPKTSSRRVFNNESILEAHLTALSREIPARGGALEWLRSAVVPGNPEASWSRTMALAESLPGNGRYFAYKYAELAQKAVGLPLQAPDAGHRYSSGPRKGLEFLYPSLPRGNRDGDIQVLDGITFQLQQEIGEPDVAILETTLCAFSSLLNGGDYIGRYIDRTLEEATDPRTLPNTSDEVMEAFFQARRDIFPDEALCELHSARRGVDKARQRVYRDTGKLLRIGEAA